MSINSRYLGRRTSNPPRIAPGSYYLRGPENREPYIPPYPPLPATPVPPTPPPPPTPSYIISGTVTDGGIGFSAPLAVSSLGTLYSAASGSYGFAVPSGYSGLVIPIWFGGTFSPLGRSYISVVADQSNQDFAFTGTTPAPPTPPIVLTGEVRLEGIPYDSATVDFSGSGSVLTDSFGTYIGTVGYGYSGLSALSGFNPPVYAITPSSRNYSSLTGNQVGQDFDIDINFLVISGTVTENGTGIPVAYTNGFGTFATASTGSYGYYVPYGWSGDTIPLSGSGTFSPASYVYGPVGVDHLNDNFAFYAYPTPPPTPSYLISGTVTEDGTGFSVPIVFDSLGTLYSDASGSYGQAVLAGYSGTATPVWFGGTFSPQERVYTNVAASLANQDYAFYGTTPTPPPTDCPIPGPNVDIPLPMGNNASRSVNDPVNNLLWVIDESGPNVYYVDTVAGTYAGSVVTNSLYGNPCIAYDSANQKIVVSTYDGSLAFINPASKAVTYSDFVQRWPSYHMLAVSDSGTAFVSDNRNQFGWLYMVDCATEKLISQFSFTPDLIFTDSIAYAENIQQLVLMSSRPFNQWFFVFDPATGVFTPSVLQTTASFSYENYYVRATGHMLMSRSGSTNVEVVDISQGANATIVTSLTGAPRRISDATEDTCSNTLFVSDGNYAIWEYTLDGNYTMLKENSDFTNGISPTGLAHSRASNLIYWQDYNVSPIPVKSIQAVQTGTTIQNAVWLPWVLQAAPSTGASVTDGTYFTFDGTTTDANGRYMVFWDGYLTNNGAPYEAKIRLEYTGSQFAVITGGGVTNSTQIEANFYNQPQVQFATNSDGSFGGVLEAFGTVYYGWNDIAIGFATSAGMSNSPPSAFFTTMTGNATITVL